MNIAIDGHKAEICVRRAKLRALFNVYGVYLEASEPVYVDYDGYQVRHVYAISMDVDQAEALLPQLSRAIERARAIAPDKKASS